VTRRLALLVALLLPAIGSAQVPASSDPAPEIVTKAARIYRGLSGLQADFRQKLADKRLGDQSSKGTLYQSGNRFAMRFSDPAGEAVVLDGSKLWVYTPSDNPGVVVRYPPPTSPVFGYNILDWFLKSPLDRYRVSFVKSETIDGRVTDAVQLQPLVPGEFQFLRATLWFDRTDGLPRRIQTDEGPQTRTVDLANVRTNGTFPTGIFAFKVPNGVKVVDQ
jgi:outer membrane lipoprotein-sorting protein